MPVKIPRALSKPEETLALNLRVAGLPTPCRNHHFDDETRMELDFAWPDYMIAAEVQGGIWMKGGGAHSRPANIERDIRKRNRATTKGWRVYEFTPKMITSGVALATLQYAMEQEDGKKPF